MALSLNDALDQALANDPRQQWDKKFGAIPADPTFNSTLNPDGTLKSGYQVSTNNLTPQLQQMLSGINLDKTALNKLQDFATSNGNSPWAQLMLQTNKLNTGSAYDSAAKSTNAGIGQAYSELGARGGLRQGAAERIAQNGANSLLNARQDVAKNDNLNQLGIMSNDAQQKLQTLQQLPGMQVQALQPDLQKASLWGQLANADATRQLQASSTNASNAIGGVKAQNDFNLGMYGTKMTAAGADRTAQATENSGKK